jgi:hypothetical protein
MILIFKIIEICVQIDAADCTDIHNDGVINCYGVEEAGVGVGVDVDVGVGVGVDVDVGVVVVLFDIGNELICTSELLIHEY